MSPENNLNQYTSRDVPGYVNVIGSAKTNATVSLWTPDGYWAQTSRKADYFRGELALNNSTGALWLTITNLAVLNNGTNPDIVTNTVGSALLARTPETFTYDLDGNLTADGLWTYSWDAENRLTAVQSLSSLPSGGRKRVEFAYDQQSRRVQKIAYTWNGSAYVAQSTNRFVYDGWNLVATLNSDFTLHNWFLWGLDLSGSPQGAGGVGGLLAIGDSTQGTHFVAFDGNGNVSALIKAGDGTLAAQYEYGPFGELIRATGPLAFVNPFLFSTKFYDLETGLYYYGYRYYSPSTGMWLGRDPHRERGGHNLYGFVHNAPTARIDKLGLFPFCNRCNKLNEVRLIKTEWEIGTTEKTPQRIEALSDSLHEVEKWDKIVNVIEIFEGKPSILFPKPDLSSKQIPLDLLAYLPVNLFGRIKFKVCVNVGPRFFFFGSDQLDWVEYTEGWDASDRNPYQSGADAVDDVEHFMEEMFKNIKEQYL